MKPNIEWLLAGSGRTRGLPMNDRIVAADDQWRATIERVQIGVDLRAFLTDVEARREVTLEPRSDRDDAWIASQLTVHGRADLTFPDGAQAQATAQHAFFFRAPEGRARYALAAGTRFRSLGYSIGTERLARLLDGQVPKTMEPLLESGATTTAVVGMSTDQVMRGVASSFFRRRLNGPLQNLLIEGGVMQLLALQVAKVSRTARTEAFRPLSLREHKVIEDAREWLLADMRQPPTLGELAARSGMTERRLNAGFRLVFQMTAFDLLRDERLSHARHALLQHGVSVKEIASLVGYNHVTNFISAFRARYGVTPRHYLRQHRVPAARRSPALRLSRSSTGPDDSRE